MADLRRASIFAVDKSLLHTNAIPVDQSPFLPYYTAMAAEVGRTLETGDVAGAQSTQLKKWVALYESGTVSVDGLLKPASLPVGSRERALATFLNAEIQLRERVTDYLMREHYAGELGQVVRGLQCEEEKVASKIKTVRGIAIAVAVVGAGVGAGGAAVGIASASAGNMAAAQTAQMTANSINNTVTSTISALASAEGSLAARSRSMSSGMSEKIGPLEVELGGETIRVTAERSHDRVRFAPIPVPNPR
jgi:hypothetical protein